VVCSDAELLEALEGLAFPQRKVLLRRLFKLKRQLPIDTFLEKLASQAQSRDRLEQLLPFGSEELVSRYQETILAQGGQVSWNRLARLHSRLALTQLQKEADTCQQFDRRLLWLVNGVLPTLAKELPDETLDLVRSLVRHIPLSSLFMQPLALARPVELSELLLTSGSKATFNLAPKAGELGTERLLNLIKYQSEVIGSWQSWFERLTPAERSTIFETLRYAGKTVKG
jgi:hypothetical protein